MAVQVGAVSSASEILSVTSAKVRIGPPKHHHVKGTHHNEVGESDDGLDAREEETPPLRTIDDTVPQGSAPDAKGTHINIRA